MKKTLKEIFRVEIVDSTSSKARNFYFKSLDEARGFYIRTHLIGSGWKLLYKRVYDTINFEKGLWCWKPV